MTILRRAFHILAPPGLRGRLSVLMFHRVLLAADPLFPDEMHARRFDELCGWLANWFNVLPLDKAAAHLKAGTLPARAACITFDDGYADNYHVALPILQKHALSSTFFISTGFLDGGRMWNDSIIESIRGCEAPTLDARSLGLGFYDIGSVAQRRHAIDALIGQIKYRPIAARLAVCTELGSLARARLPANLMMTSDEVKAMRHAGMQIGAHTVSHPILSRLEETQAHMEILNSKCFLENLLGERVGLFAYPNGKPGEDYTPQSVELVRGIGFDAAVSTQWGASGTGDDLLQIRRFTPWDRNKLRFGARMLSNLRWQ